MERYNDFVNVNNKYFEVGYRCLRRYDSIRNRADCHSLGFWLFKLMMMLLRVIVQDVISPRA